MMERFIMAAQSGDVDMSEIFDLFNSDYSIGNALLIALLGILTVFLILFVLVVVLSLFQKIFTIKLANKSSAVQNVPSAAAETQQDEETVAAIFAAISMIYAEEKGSEDAVPTFTVRRIRQINQKNKI